MKTPKWKNCPKDILLCSFFNNIMLEVKDFVSQVCPSLSDPSFPCCFTYVLPCRHYVDITCTKISSNINLRKLDAVHIVDRVGRGRRTDCKAYVSRLQFVPQINMLCSQYRNSPNSPMKVLELIRTSWGCAFTRPCLYCLFPGISYLCNIIFLCLLVKSSSCRVVFLRGPLPSGSSSCVVFLSSCEMFYL